MRRSSSEKDDHAGEMETSMGLAHFPDLVALEQADAGAVQAQPVRGGQPGLGRDHPALAPADDQLGRGRPRAATAAKGEALTTLVAERIGRFLTRAGLEPAGRDISLLNSLPSSWTGDCNNNDEPVDRLVSCYVAYLALR